MKKTTKILSILVFVLTAAFATGCKRTTTEVVTTNQPTTEATTTTEEHQHSYVQKSDASGHWTECACGETTEKQDHTFEDVVTTEPTGYSVGAKHQKCSVCGYETTDEEVAKLSLGSATAPLTVEEALKAIGSRTTNSTEEIWIKGYLSCWVWSTQYKNGDGFLYSNDEEDPNAEAIQLYQAVGASGFDVSSSIGTIVSKKPGDCAEYGLYEVVVHGKFTNYKGTQPELLKGSVLESITTDVQTISMANVNAFVGETSETSFTVNAYASKASVNVKYSIADTSIATVSDAGVVTGVAAGSTKLTILDRLTNTTKTVDVVVAAPVYPTSVELTYTDHIKDVESVKTIYNTFTSKANLVFVSGDLTVNREVYKFESDHPEFVKVDETTGLITGVAAGSATITVKAKGSYTDDYTIVDTFVVNNAGEAVVAIADIKADMAGFTVKVTGEVFDYTSNQKLSFIDVAHEHGIPVYSKGGKWDATTLGYAYTVVGKIAVYNGGLQIDLGDEPTATNFVKGAALDAPLYVELDKTAVEAADNCLLYKITGATVKTDASGSQTTNKKYPYIILTLASQKEIQIGANLADQIALFNQLKANDKVDFYGAVYYNSATPYFYPTKTVVHATDAKFGTIEKDADSKFVLSEGADFEVPFAFTPEYANTHSFTLESTATDYATVALKDGKWVITGVAAGEAEIKIMKDTTVLDTLKVLVKVVPIEKVEITNRYALTVNEEITLTSKITPSGAVQTVNWSVSDPTIASISDGKLKGLKNGSCTLTATSTKDGSKVATITIVVLDKEKASYTGSTTNMAGDTASDADVEGNALADALLIGLEDFKVYARHGEKSTNVGLNTDKTIRLYADANKTGNELTVKSKDGRIIEYIVLNVKQNFQVLKVYKGSSVEATNLLSEECTLDSGLHFYKVNSDSFTLFIDCTNAEKLQVWFNDFDLYLAEAELSSITLKDANSKSSSVYAQNKVTAETTVQLTATPNKGAQLTAGEWSTSDNTIATVSETGLVTVLAKVGTATISYTVGEVVGTYTIEVKEPIYPTALAIEAPAQGTKFYLDYDYTFNVVPTWPTGETEGIENFTWSIALKDSQETPVSTIDANGKVTFKKVETLVISVVAENPSLEGQKTEAATIEVTVEVKTVEIADLADYVGKTVRVSGIQINNGSSGQYSILLNSTNTAGCELSDETNKPFGTLNGKSLTFIGKVEVYKTSECYLLKGSLDSVVTPADATLPEYVSVPETALGIKDYARLFTITNATVTIENSKAYIYINENNKKVQLFGKIGAATTKINSLVTGDSVDVKGYFDNYNGNTPELLITAADDIVPYLRGVSISSANNLTKVVEGKTLQFSFAPLSAKATYDSATWTATNGTITNAGLFTADSITEGETLTAEIKVKLVKGEDSFEKTFELTIVKDVLTADDITITGDDKVDNGSTLQLTISCAIAGATYTIVSSNTEVATVDATGKVTGVGLVSDADTEVTIQVKDGSQNVLASKTITVKKVVTKEYTLLSSYNFSNNEIGTSNLTTKTVDFVATAAKCNNQTDVEIINAVSNITSVTGAYKASNPSVDYSNLGLKFGTGSAAGTFTIGLSQGVTKVVITGCGWSNSEKNITVNEQNASFNNVYSTDETCLNDVSIEFATSQTSLVITFAKRGFIQGIKFYSDKITE